jgi:5-methylcytosine-specific restriction endonuclease McrA
MPSLKPNGKRVNGKRSGNWCPRWKRIAIYIRDGFSCMYCGCDLRNAKPHEITLDHLDPVCDGHPKNAPAQRLVTACQRCNSKRQDRPWTQYATGGAIDRIRRTVRRKLNVDLAKALLTGRVGNPELENA